MATTGEESIFGLLPPAAASITFCFSVSLTTNEIRIGQRLEAEGAIFANS
jgi:hypothetical protein